MGKMLRAAPRGPSAQISVGTPVNNLRAYGNPIPYVAPWATAFVFWFLALIERMAFHADVYVWYWSVFVALVYLAITAGAWWASRPRGVLTCTITTGGFAAIGMWTWYLGGVEHQSWRMHVVYWGGALVVCTVSMIWSASKSARGDGSGVGWLDQVGKAVSKVRGVNAIEITPTGEVVAEYRMQPGTPAAALQQDAAELAALIPGMRPDGVKLLPSRDDAVVGSMRLTPVDRLREPPPWPGPSIPWGGTADQPIRIGTRSAGGWSELWLCADPELMRPAPILSIVGMSGSGKTLLVRMGIVEILSRFDTEYWYANARKAGQEPEWVLRGAARVADGRKATAQMLKDVKAEVSVRSKLLGAHGCEVWTSACCYAKHGIRNRVVIIDEAAEVATEMASTLTDIGESVRSTGQGVWVILQRGTGDRYPTSARAQCNGHVCLGVQEENDAVHGGLPDDVLDAGAQPWLWGANQAGMHINATPGVPDDLRATDCRTFDTRGKAQVMAEIADQYIEAREAGATPWSSRPDGAPTAVLDTDEPAEFGEAEHLVAEMVADDLEADSDVELADIAEDTKVILTEQDEADLAAVGVDDEIPVPGPPPETIAIEPKMTPAAGRRAVYGYIVRLAAAGVKQFRVSDHVEDINSATGLKSRWMYGVAEEFCEPSDCGPAILRQIEERGPYEILGAALEPSLLEQAAIEAP